MLKRDRVICLLSLGALPMCHNEVRASVFSLPELTGASSPAAPTICLPYRLGFPKQGELPQPGVPIAWKGSPTPPQHKSGVTGIAIII